MSAPQGDFEHIKDGDADDYGCITSASISWPSVSCPPESRSSPIGVTILLCVSMHVNTDHMANVGTLKTSLTSHSFH